jgi:hypothetical protein
MSYYNILHIINHPFKKIIKTTYFNKNIFIIASNIIIFIKQTQINGDLTFYRTNNSLIKLDTSYLKLEN